MTADTQITGKVDIPGAPQIPGLLFRYYRGESDIPGMVAVLEGSKGADQLEEVDTVENMTRAYSNMKNCDPQQDVVVVEKDGKIIGYKRVTWWEEDDETGTRVYGHFGFLLPEFRGRGIGSALFRHSENRLRENAREHPAGPKVFDVAAAETQTALQDLILREGYEPVRHFCEMVRPDLENIPDLPLPEGLEVRPVQPEHYRAIWDAGVEAFKDHWGQETTEEADYERWLNEPHFQPHLWQVAWDGDEVAGSILNFIDEDQNARFNRKRGWVENISTRRAWRKRGLASALIARSFHVHKEAGMEEGALGVDTENPSGALQIYRNMGFREVRRETSYRKPMAE